MTNNEDIELIIIRVNRFIKLYDFLKMDLKMTKVLSHKYEKKFIEEVLPQDLSNINDLNDLEGNKNEDCRKSCNIKIDKSNLKELNDKEKMDKNLDEEIEKEFRKKDTKNKMLKKLYYKVSKIAHPDKCNDKIKNKMFINAKEYYESNILIGLLEICTRLDIELDLQEIEKKEFVIIYNNIKNIETDIKKFKDSVSWKWSNSNDKEQKSKIKMWIKDKIMKYFLKEYEFHINKLYPKNIDIDNKIYNEIISFLYPICLICNQEFKEKNKIGLIKKCKHEYHIGCLTKWIDKRNKYKCPICIKEI